MKLERGLAEYPTEIGRDSSSHLGSVGEEPISLRDLLSKIWLGSRIIVLTATIFFVIAVLAVSQTETRYRASTSVMFGTQKVNVTDLREMLSDPEFSKDTLQNEIEVLRSTGLIERVVNALSLNDNAEFTPPSSARRPHLADRMRAVLPPRLFELFAGFGLVAPKMPAPSAAEARLREHLGVIALVLEGLTLRPIEGTRVIEISFSSASPETAAEIANAIADQYIADQVVAKTQTTRAGIEWLTVTVENSRRQLRAAEEAVETLRAGLSESAGQSLEITEQQLVALNAAQPVARSATAEADGRYQRLTEALRNEADPRAITEFRDAPVIKEYREQESAMLARLETMSSDHPGRRRVEAQLADIHVRIRAEATSIAGAVRIDLDAARAQEASLAASVRELETKALAQSRERVQLRQLEREAEASRLIYQTMLNRLKETSEQVELQEANARVLSRADIPLAPESSRKRLIVAMASTLGVLAGVALVFLLDHLNDRFHAPRRIEDLTGFPVLATIPSIGSRRQRGDVIRQLRDKPTSSLAEAVRNLRTSILFSTLDSPPRIVMFTSSVPREGKSTTSMLTALTSRQMGRSAIIVDCDLRQPTAGQTLRAERTHQGLLAVLEGAATIDEAVYMDPDTGLHVLVFQPDEQTTQMNAADVLASARFKDLIRALAERYDLVVLDTPPVLVVTDARILSSIADAVIYTVRWDSTPRGAVLEGLKELQSVNAPIAGIALTMVNEAKASKYSVDGYIYYRGRYKDYYAEPTARSARGRIARS